MQFLKTFLNNRSIGLYYFLLSLLFIVLFGLTVTFVQQERKHTIQERIDNVGAQLVRSLRESLRLSVENLRSVSNVIIFDETISLSQFQTITAQNFEADEGLLIIEWQPVVPAQQRQQFEENARERGLTEFRLWQPDILGRPIAAKQRDEYVPVYFMRTRNVENDSVDTLGLDLAWSVERMTSKWQSRDSGRATASEFFRVITGPSTEYQPLGFAITVPIYRTGFTPESVAERKVNLVGYMAAIYSLEDIFTVCIKELSALGINLDIYDFRDNDFRLTRRIGNDSEFNTTLEVDLYGTNLFISLTASDRFVDTQFQIIWIVLPLGVLTFGLVSFIFLRSLNKNNQQLTLAQTDLRALNDKLQELSRHDPLTDLLNRRAFLEKVGQELDRIERQGESVSLLLLDLDHFKGINDKWGHPSGDRVLKEFARICTRCCRSFDTVARLGGEEFGILLLHTNPRDAFHFAERLRITVAEKEIFLDAHNTHIGITVSIGICTIDERMPVKKWMAQTDQALYEAKDAGRDCIKEYK